MALDLSMPILVVDDNPSVLGVLVLLLEKIGFAEVDEAADGVAALAKMHDKNYGLVISDWQMQPMDGYDLLTRIRSSKTLAAMPFIMVTVNSEMGKAISAMQAGANGYILKPFSAKMLTSKIKLAVKGRGRFNRRPMSEADLEKSRSEPGDLPYDRVLAAERARKRGRRSILGRFKIVRRDVQRSD
jgi:two-component system, chemotaxis family, chemotaxis protein CheY